MNLATQWKNNLWTWPLARRWKTTSNLWTWQNDKKIIYEPGNTVGSPQDVLRQRLLSLLQKQLNLIRGKLRILKLVWYGILGHLGTTRQSGGLQSFFYSSGYIIPKIYFKYSPRQYAQLFSSTLFCQVSFQWNRLSYLTFSLTMTG